MSAEDPRPWLEEGAPSDDLRSLLDSARLDDPSDAQLASLAKKLGPLLVLPAAAAVVAPAAATGGAASTAGAAAAKTAVAVKTGLAVKALVTVAAVAAVGGASFQAGRVYEEKVAPKKMVERPVIVVAPAPPPVPVVVPEPEPVAPPVEPEPVVTAPKPVKVAAPTPQAEAAMLEQAMGALKANDWAKALALCDRHAKELGAKGLLTQEREVIAIEALVRLGRQPEAKARAEKFKKAFPTSTHLLKVEALVAQ